MRVFQLPRRRQLKQTAQTSLPTASYYSVWDSVARFAKEIRASEFMSDMIRRRDAYGSEGAMGIYKANMEGGDRNAEPYLRSTYGTLAQAQAEFSPDGHWVAYSSNESGREEIYVQPFPGPGGKWIVSSDGGSVPRWSRSGREIFYRNADKMMSVEVQTQPTFQAGTPHVLFQGSYSITPYDVAPDSQHFLLVKDKEGQPEAREVRVVLNWVEELKRRVPAK